MFNAFTEYTCVRLCVNVCEMRGTYVQSEGKNTHTHFWPLNGDGRAETGKGRTWITDYLKYFFRKNVKKK